MVSTAQACLISSFGKNWEYMPKRGDHNITNDWSIVLLLGRDYWKDRDSTHLTAWETWNLCRRSQFRTLSSRPRISPWDNLQITSRSKTSHATVPFRVQLSSSIGGWGNMKLWWRFWHAVLCRRLCTSLQKTHWTLWRTRQKDTEFGANVPQPQIEKRQETGAGRIRENGNPRGNHWLIISRLVDWQELYSGVGNSLLWRNISVLIWLEQFPR